MSQFLEAAMLICFGCSWPMSVYKNIKAKTAKSMSLPFILLIITGYICGIAAKIVTNTINYVLAVYILNLIIVSADLAVYFINRRYDNATKQKTAIADDEKLCAAAKKQPVITDRAINAKLKEYSNINCFAKRGGTVFLGGKYFYGMPINELAQDFESDGVLYNRSISKLTAEYAEIVFDEAVKPICPDAVFLNLGEQDLKNPNFNEDEFINNYRRLISGIREQNIAVYIVSVISNAPAAAALNRRLDMLADEIGCEYIDAVNVLKSDFPQQNLFNLLCSLNVRHKVSFAKAMSM